MKKQGWIPRSGSNLAFLQWQKKICPELHLTPLSLSVSPFLSFTAPKLPHVNTHRRSVYLTAQGQIHTCVQKKKNTLGVLESFLVLVSSSWPLDGL